MILTSGFIAGSSILPLITLEKRNRRTASPALLYSAHASLVQHPPSFFTMEIITRVTQREVPTKMT